MNEHRWSAKADARIRPFSLRDRCLSCGVPRDDPMPGERALMRNAIAVGPCPNKPLRELTEAEIDEAVARYTEEPTP